MIQNKMDISKSKLQERLVEIEVEVVPNIEEPDQIPAPKKIVKKVIQKG
jgi:hypothetical protein